MSATITTLVQKLEKGYMKSVRFDADKILYVSGKRKKVSETLSFPCQTPEELAASANGGKTHFLQLSDVTRFRTRSDRKTIDVGFKDAKGRSCTIEIDAPDKATKELVFLAYGKVLESAGHEQTQRSVSAFGVSWGPILVMLATFVMGGLLTASQASGEGLVLDESHGGGRSARRARGLQLMIAGIANTLGFWGCLGITLLVFLGALAYWIRRLAKRPVSTIWAASEN